MIRFYKILAVTLIMTASLNAADKFHGAHAGVGNKLNYDSLFNAATPLDQSTEGQAAVSSCFETYGGEEHLQKLHTLHLKYKMMAYMVREMVPVDKYFQRERKHKIIRHQESAKETRLINGDKSWYIGRDTVVEYYSGKHKAELFSYLTLSMPLGIKTESFTEIRFGTREGDSLGYLYMLKKDSIMIVIGLDPKDNFYIKKSEGIIYEGDKNFSFVNEFSDFQKVEGYVIPFSTINMSMGLEVARSRVSLVEINPELDKSFFLPIATSKEDKKPD